MRGRYKTWTVSEEKFLKENYRKMTAQEIANELGRTVYSVEARAKRLNLKKRNTLYRAVKDGEVIAIGTSDELAKRFGVKKKTIHEYSTPKHSENNYSLIIEKAGVME